jgi:2-dehydropantoate 2-reductase
VKVLVYGAGVIGSIFAVKLANSGVDVTLYARRHRLQALRDKGLLYEENGETRQARVTVADHISDGDIFDFVLVAVRYEQIGTALAELTSNQSRIIVTLVNNPDGYTEWELILGSGRLLPGFPGAGGHIGDDGVLRFQLTPKMVQATTIGEPDGKRTPRTEQLRTVLTRAGIPTKVSANMEAWQKTHVAMVTALANGIYFDGGTNRTTATNRQAIAYTTKSLQTNFAKLHSIGVPATPAVMNIMRWCPAWIMNAVLRRVLGSSFADSMINAHAQTAKAECLALDKNFQDMLNQEHEKQK